MKLILLCVQLSITGLFNFISIYGVDNKIFFLSIWENYEFLTIFNYDNKLLFSG